MVYHACKLLSGLVKKTTCPSWDHFCLKASVKGFIIESEKNKPVCNHCNKGVAGKGGNTSGDNLH